MSLDGTESTKKIQVDPESWTSVEQFEDNRAFEVFEEDNEFKDDHAFEEFTNESEFNDDHALEDFEVENQFHQVRKFVRLIFIYYKSEVAGCRSGLEIGTDLHLLQVQGLRPIRSGNLDKTNSQKRLLGFPSYTKTSLKISWEKWSVYIFEVGYIFRFDILISILKNIFALKGHVFYCNSSRGPNFFKPQTRPLLENLINIVVGRTLAFQNALKQGFQLISAQGPHGVNLFSRRPAKKNFLFKKKKPPSKKLLLWHLVDTAADRTAASYFYALQNHLAGSIKSVRVPHAAHGRYVWHPCSKANLYVFGAHICKKRKFTKVGSFSQARNLSTFPHLSTRSFLPVFKTGFGRPFLKPVFKTSF